MKQWCIGMFVYLAGITALMAPYSRAEEFEATLPDGTRITLIGLRNYSIQDLEKFKDGDYPWWRPDGTTLAISPDTGHGRTSTTMSYWFVIRVEGNRDCAFKAVGPCGDDLAVRPVTRKAKGFEQDDLRYFTLRFSPNQTQGDVKLGMACGDWRIADRWSIEPDWTPYNLSIGSSDQLVLRCPEQMGSDVVVELTQIVTERTTRLVLFDRDGNRYESEGDAGGEGVGLIRYVYKFRNMERKNIEHLEFQVRPYQYWITFRKVSLKVGQKTRPDVEIKQPATLLKGNELPGFDGIEIDFTDEGNRDKKLLVCFFDMNQRPSRRCVNEMAKQAGQLKEQGLSIVAIQAAKVQRDKLDEWIQKNSVPFPVGMIEKDIEKTRFTWGVRSLPWIILTDSQHLVIDSGFGLGELAGKIKAAH